MNYKLYILLIITTLIVSSCKNDKKRDIINSSKTVASVNDSLKIKKDSTKVSFKEKTSPIDSFLIQPFDLIKFKKIKRSSNSGGWNKRDYYFNPDYKGMYYRYFVFSNFRGYLGKNKKLVLRKENGLNIIVYKKTGEYQYKFDDPTEKLIELTATVNDFDLPELAFVGIDSAEIINKLGNEDFYKNGCMVYSYKNYVLILKIDNKKVEWLKYINLSIKLTKDKEINDLYKMNSH